MYYYTLKYRDIKLGVPDVSILISVITGYYVQDKGFGDASVPDWVVSRILCKIGDRCILPFFTSVDKGN
jgi:hypothetical protein